MFKRLLVPLLALFLITRNADAVPTCVISGIITDGANNPVANGVVTFNTLFTQVVSSNTINQTLVSTTTDATGALVPIALAQGVYVQITVNGGAPVTAIVPFTTAASFSSVISNVVANPSSTTLDVIGSTPAPSCDTGNAVIYFDSVDHTLKVNQDCSSYLNFVLTPDTAVNNSVLVGDGTTWQSQVVPDCQDAAGNHLNFIAASNSFTCGNTSSGGGGGGGSNPQTDATSILFNQADNTKLMRFSLSGLTTATTRVFTVPDRDATMGTTTGTLTSQNLAKFDASGNIVDDGISILSLSGNTTKAATISGALTTNHILKADASGNLVDAGVAAGGKMFATMKSGTPSTSATSYSPIFGMPGGFSTEPTTLQIVPIAATFKNMYCSVNNAPGGGNAWALTARKNGGSTALTCTISGSATDCQDLTHTFTVAAGDLLAIQITPSGGPAAASLTCGEEIDPS